MKYCSPSLGLAPRLLALSVSLAVVLSSYAFAFASPAKTAHNSGGLNASQTDSANGRLTLILTSTSAIVTKAGVLLRWSTNSVSDNLGFNVYRLKDGQRTRINKEIIPGALFALGTPALIRAGYSYAWFDRGGSADSTYFIESVNVEGASKTLGALRPVTSKTVSEFEQTPEALNGGSTSASESTNTFEKNYPTAEAQQSGSASGTVQEQWVIAGQTALKIAIKKDGWYRVTQPQMVAAGFNPSVDIRNLRLFTDASEVAINTNQNRGQFSSGDYIEFYGRGLDTPTTDKRIYYLAAGTTPGKRVGGDIQLDGDPILPPAPTSTPPPVTPAPPLLRDPIFFSWIQNDISFLLSLLEPGRTPDEQDTKKPETANAPHSSTLNSGADRAPVDYPLEYSEPGGVQEEQTANAGRGPRAGSPRGVPGVGSKDNSTALANDALSIIAPAPKVSTPLPASAAKAGRQLRKRQLRKGRGSSRRAKRKGQRQRKPEHSHALAPDGFAPANFAYTTEIKERFVYFTSLLNGDEENYFGRVISSPVTQTLTVTNPDLTASGPATLEFALQGVANQSFANHQVSVAFNGVNIGSLTFGALEHPVRTFSIPLAQVLSGNNTITFTKTSTGEVCIVDYLKLTYPHAFKVDANSLKFNLRGSQTLRVDGFSAPAVRLIDYTDPLNVRITKPASESSAAGYAITVPLSESRSKAQRLLYAIPEGQFDQPAALSLNQPSTLNANSNAGSFLIIAHKNFIPNMATLLTQRQGQGFATSIVDVDDVYDEFSYGKHGPQAMRDFLQYAATQWATPPRYIIFAGDASLDPRNYEGAGDFDFVPTKLVDATYNETASDDWLADFDDDGIANIPVGRLPFRTAADANLIVSKIVNFTPPQPQSAMLVADEDEFNIFGFAQTNDTFQSFLPASMTVQRLNRAPQPPGVPAQNLVKADIVNGFNQGRALVNYSGHGNVDVWTGASLFDSADALALNNTNNRLSFVVVMDCLNGYFQAPNLLSLSEAFLKAPNGGAVAAFASSGLTIAQGQHDMGRELYRQLYGASPIALGDAIKIAKGATFDIDVKRTWVFFGDPSIKIR